MQLKTRSALAALTAAASNLPGYAQAEPAESGYRITQYQEGNLAASRSASSKSVERFRITTHQLSHSQTVLNDWQLDADVMYETMSGASPWFVTPGANDKPVQVMSGASIYEERAAVSTSFSRELDEDSDLAVNLSLSDEDDYESISGGASYALETNQQHRIWSAGFGLSEDKLRPTEGGTAAYPDRITRASKSSWNAVFGLTQIVNKTTQAQVSLSVAQDSGFLSDPYKLTFVDNQTLPDSRPSQRNQYALTTRLRRYFGKLSTVMRLDWRHFRDNWGIVSDTVEAGAIWRPGAGAWRGYASLRWYQQSQADFYGPYFPDRPASGLYSSDYRLSPYGALSPKVGFDYFRGPLSIGFSVAQYNSSGGLALARVDTANPGLVDFHYVSAALQWQFGGGRRAEPGLTPSPEISVVPVDQSGGE